MLKTQLQKNRRTAFAHQQGRCFYCAARMWIDDCEDFARQHSLNPEDAAGFKCTAEHLKAKNLGGTNAIANIVAACEFCNKLRHQFVPGWTPRRHKTQVMRLLRHYSLVYRLFGENLDPRFRGDDGAGV